jgi:hypothetical protein
MQKIDWKMINWERIFGVIKGADTMKRNQMLFLRTEIIEKAIASESKGQLEYVGDVEEYDFNGIDGLRYECKLKAKIFQARTGLTEQITARNHRATTKKVIAKRWDKMILIEENTSTIGLVDYDHAIWKNNDADLKVRFNDYNVKRIVTQVKPCSELSKVDFNSAINETVEKLSQIQSRTKVITRKRNGENQHHR